MVYRIDIQHFLTHMIDHFSSDDLVRFQYKIISAKIVNEGLCGNVQKINELYPTSNIVSAYAEYEDTKILEKMFMSILEPDNSKEGDYIANKVYRTIIDPLLNHQDIVLLCDKSENAYLDVLCEFLTKKFAIEVIDLNKLFTDGIVDPIYIDRKEINNKAVDIRRKAVNDMYRSLESTKDGREKLLSKMRTKDKKRKLKELGITVTSNDTDLDKLLIDAWVNGDEDEDDYKEWD